MRYIELREHLYNSRIKKGLTQQQASEILGIGRPYYNLLEKGVRKNPRICLAKKIADFCEVDVKTIYGGK